MESKFPIVELSGTHYEIGLQHGKLLKDRIPKTIEFYKTIWKQSDQIILETVQEFKSVIQKEVPQYAEEISGIAEGSGIEEDWIYALNCRTEILSIMTNEFNQECTAVYFPENSILGQNWDWAIELEDLAVIMVIHRGEHSIIQMTEPGIIGKIGMNSAGLGVTLNLLKSESRAFGVPIHIILRIALDSTSIEAFTQSIETIKLGKASNIIVGNAKGKYVDFEFGGDKVYIIDNNSRMFHTNHYLQDHISADPVEFASSLARYARAREIISQVEPTVTGLQNILGDSYNSELPICRPYVVDEAINTVGTVCSIVMDLKHLKFHITKGSPLSNAFTEIAFKDYIK